MAMENQLVDNMPAFRRFLVPSDIVSDLLMMFELENERCTIREKLLLIEETDRVEAVTRLIGEVLAHGDHGFNLLLNALRGEEGELPDWWDRALHLRESSPLQEMKSEQCVLLMGAFEGQVTRRISEGELKTILLELVTRKVLNRTDLAQTRAKLNGQGREKAAQHMFTCLRRNTQNWAWELFFVLVKIKPELVRKIDPCNDESSTQDQAERNTSRATLNDTADREAPAQRDLASSSAADVSDDDSEASFSDDEKKDKVSDSEKEQKNRRPKRESCHPRDLCLREYQIELSKFALQGLNTIVCAPTGSGKTRVAVHIVRQHLSAATGDTVLDGRTRKVAFLARTVPLVTQQYKNFEKFLPNFKTICVTGESEYSMHLHNLLPQYDILVLTPRVLENHIKPDKIPSLAAFSLLIFDECHHTRKGEPYNSLMKSYLKSMKEQQPNLPQIVGLTASIGVEKATTVSEAADSILTIMGNMNVERLSTVKVNKKELEDTVPRPEEDKEQLVSREKDEISTKIKEIMEEVQNMLIDRGASLDEMEIDNLLMKVPPNKASQQYGQWAVSLRNQVRLLKFSATDPNTSDGKEEDKKQFARDVQVLANVLVAYNEALEVHDLTRPQDVLQHLQRKIEQKVTKENATPCEKEVLGLYKEGLKTTLLKSKETNPNLDILGETMIKHLEKNDEESRIIIFVRTRATCRAVCEWLNSHREHVLQTLKATPFTGAGAHRDTGGMTQCEQEAVIDKFRRGDVRVLVTTSVGEEGIDIPECNLVIKYNHVGNEVTTVQTRGRSRKQGGRSILMAQPKILMQEVLNQSRAAMMYLAIQQVDAMATEEVKQRVQLVQNKILESEEIRSIVRKSITRNRLKEKFSLECCQCHKLSVDGSQLRTINDSHHVIIGKAFSQQVTIRQKQPKRVDDMIFSGQVACKECKNHLGQILNYDGVDFITVGIKTWTLLDKDHKPLYYKRWREVPYDIGELAPDDIKEHLASETDLDQGPPQTPRAAGSDI